MPSMSCLLCILRCMLWCGWDSINNFSHNSLAYPIIQSSWADPYYQNKILFGYELVHIKRPILKLHGWVGYRRGAARKNRKVNNRPKRKDWVGQVLFAFVVGSYRRGCCMELSAFLGRWKGYYLLRVIVAVSRPQRAIKMLSQGK